MASIPESTKTSLHQRLVAHARGHWPGIEQITLKFRGHYAYIGAVVRDDHDTEPEPEIKLLRLRYGGYASVWGPALWRASHDDYQPTRMPDGTASATPENALDLAADLYLPQTRRTSTDDH